MCLVAVEVDNVVEQEVVMRDELASVRTDVGVRAVHVHDEVGCRPAERAVVLVRLRVIRRRHQVSVVPVHAAREPGDAVVDVLAIEQLLHA